MSRRADTLVLGDYVAAAAAAAAAERSTAETAAAAAAVVAPAATGIGTTAVVILADVDMTGPDTAGGPCHSVTSLSSRGLWTQKSTQFV
jgi:hypothetical protein